MYKRRRTAMPTLPTDPRSCDATLVGSRFANVGQSPFYRGQVTVGDNDTAVIFASDEQLELLRTASVVYIDATFRVVPTLFHQLFTMFVPFAEHTFPVCFALMSRKTSEMYEAVFRVVHELVPEFQPSQIIADFEEAPATAARAVFGNDLIISGCWFHFAQALVKRMRKLGLVIPLRDDSGLQTLFRCLLSLPLLPVDDVRPGFEDVRLTLDDQSPSKSLMQRLLRYIQKQWLDKSTVGPSRMSVRDNEARTNNAVESFHASLRRRIKVPHPNLFVFLGHLQQVTLDSQSDVNRITSGLHIRRAKKRINIINDKRIKTCFQRFDNGKYTRLQFLRAVSHAVGADMMTTDSQVTTDDDDTHDEDDQTQPQATSSSSAAAGTASTASADTVDSCDVCLVAPRNARFALVPCGHQRFCETCANAVHAQSRGCPLCRTPITMVLHLY